MKKIVVILVFINIVLFTLAQQNNIKLSGLQVNNNPLVRVDPVTGHTSDTLPKLFHFTFNADDLPKAKAVHIKLSTASDHAGDVGNITFEIINENGNFLVKNGMFTEPVMQTPPEIIQQNPGIPKYMFRLPVELNRTQEAIWKFASVIIEDTDNLTSEPVVFTR